MSIMNFKVAFSNGKTLIGAWIVRREIKRLTCFRVLPGTLERIPVRAGRTTVDYVGHAEVSRIGTLNGRTSKPGFVSVNFHTLNVDFEVARATSVVTLL